MEIGNFGERILCGYGREKYTGNKRIDSTSVGGGKSANNG